MIRRPPRSTLFPSRRSSDLRKFSHCGKKVKTLDRTQRETALHPGGLYPTSTGVLELNQQCRQIHVRDRKSTRLNSSHSQISYAVFCLKKKKHAHPAIPHPPSAYSWEASIPHRLSAHLAAGGPLSLRRPPRTSYARASAPPGADHGQRT